MSKKEWLKEIGKDYVEIVLVKGSLIFVAMYGLILGLFGIIAKLNSRETGRE